MEAMNGSSFSPSLSPSEMHNAPPPPPLIESSGDNNSRPTTIGQQQQCLRIYDRKIPSRAHLTCPEQLEIRHFPPPKKLRFLEQKHRAQSAGVFARTELGARTRFGPVEAPMIGVRPHDDDDDDDGCVVVADDEQDQDAVDAATAERRGRRFRLKLFLQDGRPLCHLDLSDEDQSNWMVFIRAARRRHEQNLVAVQDGFEVFYETSRRVEPGEELAVWYGRGVDCDYAKRMRAEALDDGDMTTTTAGVAKEGPRSNSSGIEPDILLSGAVQAATPMETTATPTDMLRRKGERLQAVAAGAAKRQLAARQQQQQQQHVTVVASSSPLPPLLPVGEEEEEQPLNLSRRDGVAEQQQLALPVQQLATAMPEQLLAAQRFAALSVAAPGGMVDAQEAARQAVIAAFQNARRQLLENSAAAAAAAAAASTNPFAFDLNESPLAAAIRQRHLHHQQPDLYAQLRQQQQQQQPLSDLQRALQSFQQQPPQAHAAAQLPMPPLVSSAASMCVVAPSNSPPRQTPDGPPTMAAEQQSLVVPLGAANAATTSPPRKKRRRKAPGTAVTANSNGGVVAAPVRVQKKNPVACIQCGKVFSAAKDLKRHVATHTGIKAHPCPHCAKKFGRKDHVRRHVQTVHERQPRGSGGGANALKKEATQQHNGSSPNDSSNDSASMLRGNAAFAHDILWPPSATVVSENDTVMPNSDALQSLVQSATMLQQISNGSATDAVKAE